MKIIRFLILLILIGSRSFGQSCDSIVIIYQTNHDQFEPVTFVSTQTDTIRNGLVVARTSSWGYSIKFNYDSLDRLISKVSNNNDSIVYTYDTNSNLISEEYFYWNGTIWQYLPGLSIVNYYYTVNRLDSTVNSEWNGSSMISFYKIIRFYNASDTMYQINIERFDSATSWYIDTLATVSYTPNRTDSLYRDGVITTYPDEIRVYDSFDRILSITEILSGFADGFQYFSYQCNQLASYTSSHFGSHCSYDIRVTFDSLCRARTRSEGHSCLTGANTENINEYYYVSCNHMVVRADEDVRLCQGDSAELSVMHFGGTPPYQINWSPGSVFPNDSQEVVNASPDSTVDYIVTVTDSNGLIAHDTLNVHVANRPIADIYISTIDTLSNCQSATLKSDSIPNTGYSWREISSPVTINNNSELEIINNGTYILYSQEVVNSWWLISCPAAIDTFVFNYFSNPAPEIDINLECTFIVANSTENLTYQWYRNSLLIPDSINDTLFINQDGTYYAIGVDSLNCPSSATYGESFHLPVAPLTLTVGVGHPSCDTCSDGYVNLQGHGGPPGNYYSYIINGVPSNNSYHDSLPNGIYQFCVVDRNGCVFCDSAVYLPVNEIIVNKVLLYPNPFNEILHLKYPFYKSNAKTRFVLYDEIGRVIKDFKITSPEFILTRESMISGLYFYSIIENGIVLDHGKIILN